MIKRVCGAIVNHATTWAETTGPRPVPRWLVNLLKYGEPNHTASVTRNHHSVERKSRLQLILSERPSIAELEVEGA